MVLLAAHVADRSVAKTRSPVRGAERNVANDLYRTGCNRPRKKHRRADEGRRATVLTLSLSHSLQCRTVDVAGARRSVQDCVRPFGIFAGSILYSSGSQIAFCGPVEGCKALTSTLPPLSF